MVEKLFNLSDEERARIVARIHAANVTSMVPTDGMAVDYDAETDYLRVLIGEPHESLALDMDDESSSVMLYDPDTFVILGMEVPAFSASLDSGLLKEDFWQFVWQLIEAHGSNIFIPASQEIERANRAFREVVPA